MRTQIALASTPYKSPLGPISQIVHSIKNIDAAKRWYAEVCGLKNLSSFRNPAFFEGHGGVARSILYVRVPDIRASHAALSARGVHFTHAPHMIHRHDDRTEEWRAFFQDHDDRPLAIMVQAGSNPR